MKSKLLFLMIAILSGGHLFAQLSEATQKDLQFMREEEKLVQDVYAHLGKKWDLTPFHHIQQSEQEHMNRLGELMAEFNVKDPYVSTGNKPGVFENKDLQKLYNRQITQGEKSMVEALKVGAFLEETDINDLDKAIERTENQRVLQVFQQLRDASESHLQAFVRNLSTEGVNYEPKVLSKERYDGILNPKTSGCDKNKQGNKSCCGKKGQATGKGKCCATK
jgi:hypothetical protein